MRRGEVWWARLEGPAKTRPVLLLSRDAAYERRTMITIAPISTRIRRIRAEVRLTQEDGFPQDCAVNLDSIQTIYKAFLTNRITVLTSERMAQVERAIKFALALK